jgi:phosphoribosylanthranilate isomerase
MSDDVPLFRIKICGVTSVADAELVADSGADAIGFNLASRSSRCVDIGPARAMANVVQGRLLRVGVFLNHSVEEIERIANDVGLDVAQLHGDESPEFCRQLSIPVIKSLPYAGGDAQRLVDYWQRCGKGDSAGDGKLLGLLIDASVAGLYGGTGATVDWDELAKERADLGQIPWALAGGLHAGNVAGAIATVRPMGVDVASGVESAPGVKDGAKVLEFVRAAQRALDSA